MQTTFCDRFTATILTGAYKSDWIRITNRSLVRIVYPAGWTAAALTFDGSFDPENTPAANVANEVPLLDRYGAELSLNVTAGRSASLDPVEYFGLNWVRLRSGTLAASVDQLADRSILLVAKPFV